VYSRLHELRWRDGKPGKLNLAHFGREISRADVHLFSNVFGDNVDNKLASAADVARRVFGNEPLVRAVSHSHADNGRVGTEIVVGAEGRRIEDSVLIDTGNQRNRSRGHETHQQFVSMICGTLFEIKIHGLKYS